MPSAAEREKRVRRWRARADELRATLQTMRDPFVRDALRRIADDYDSMADTAEHGVEVAARLAAG